MKKFIVGIIAVLMLLACYPAQASFVILNDSADIDSVNGVVNFSLTFSSPPDLVTVDQYGRMATQFQYFIFTGDPVPGAPLLGYLQTVIRETPSYLANHQLLVQSIVPPSNPDPVLGGWGAILAVADFTLNGNTLSFSAPSSFLLGVNGEINYELFSFEYGTTASSLHIPPVPEISTWAMLLLGFVTISVMSYRRRGQPHIA